MGVYVYSLRAKTIALVMSSGDKLRANLYSYAYRASSLWRGDTGYNSYQLTVENTQRNAANVFARERSGVVVVGDLKSGLEGCSVYTDVTEAQWVDTEKFPGTFAGWIAKVGKFYRVVDHTRWSDVQVLTGDQWVPMRSRLVFTDGEVKQERLTIGCQADIEREVSALMEASQL